MIGNVWEWTTSQPGGGEPTNEIKGSSFSCAAN
jgi:formylglycine-generating enzyme required for sulfatase activity